VLKGKGGNLIVGRLFHKEGGGTRFSTPWVEFPGTLTPPPMDAICQQTFSIPKPTPFYVGRERRNPPFMGGAHNGGTEVKGVPRGASSGKSPIFRGERMRGD